MISQTNPPARKGFLDSLGRAFVVVFVIIILAIVFFMGYKLLNNRAQQQARIMREYAKVHHLIKFRTDGDPGIGPDNTTPWQQIYYRTTEQPATLKDSLETFLTAKGYMVSENLFDPGPCIGPTGDIESIENGAPGSPNCPGPGESGGGGANNGGKPYWVIWGNKNNTSIEAEITDVTYSDSSNTGNLYKGIVGQHPVPPGNAVLDITFSVN